MHQQKVPAPVGVTAGVLGFGFLVGAACCPTYMACTWHSVHGRARDRRVADVWSSSAGRNAWMRRVDSARCALVPAGSRRAGRRRHLRVSLRGRGQVRSGVRSSSSSNQLDLPATYQGTSSRRLDTPQTQTGSRSRCSVASHSQTDPPRPSEGAAVRIRPPQGICIYVPPAAGVQGTTAVTHVGQAMDS